MTIRLSIISLAGKARTLVAVGTSNDADMFFTTAAAAPRSTRVSSPSADGTGAAAFGLAGVAGDFCSVEAPLLVGAVLAGGSRRRLLGRSGLRLRRCGRLGRLPIAGRRTGVDGRFRRVVDQEFMPAGIDRGGIFAELAIHLLDQPFVLPEWFR